MRRRLKQALAHLPTAGDPRGTSVLIYHRVGGGSPDERDVTAASFHEQVDALAGRDVVGIDEAARRLAAGDDSPSVVLTFDDGFRDVHANAWPLLRKRGLPFTIYLSTAFVGGTMHWDGSTARAAGPALTWDQLREMTASGLCTIGNHTHTHVRPEQLSVEELEACQAAVRSELGVTPQHFAYTWGVPVPAMEPELRRRFVTSATGELGRNRPGADPARWRRIPVRGTDPIGFFRAKLDRALVAERAYARVVGLAKAVGVRA